MGKTKSILIIFSWFLMISAYPQQTQWVTSSGDSGPGTLRDAITNASPGDIIRFLPEISVVQLQTDEILVDKPLKIIGNAGLTTIKRNLSPSTPHFRIFNIDFTGDENDTLFLENLLIRNGFSPAGNSENQDGRDGGAVLVNNSYLTVKIIHCEFSYNQCGSGASGSGISNKTQGRGRAQPGRGGHGGAIYSNAALILDSTRFAGNKTGKGGDLRGSNSTGTTYAGNGGNGGAIFSEGYLVIYGCEFVENQTDTGGTAQHMSENYVTTYGGNGGSGGAIYSNSRLEIYNSLFSDNKTAGGAEGEGDWNVQGYGGQGGNGGAIYSNDSLLILDHCSFSENKTGDGAQGTGAAGAGGKGGSGGAIFTVNTIVRSYFCLFQSNIAGKGNSGSGLQAGQGGSGGNAGAFYTKNCDVDCDQSLFQENYSGDGGYSGGGYYSYSGYGGNAGAFFAENCTGTITNTGFLENHTGKAGNSYIYFDYDYSVANPGGAGGAIFLRHNCSLILSKCNFLDNYTGDGGSYTGPGDTTNLGGNGGNGGAIAIDDHSIINLVNSLICRNITGVAGVNQTDSTKTGYNGKGGGICLSAGSTLRLINSTMAGNNTGFTSDTYSYIPKPGNGGGIYCSDTAITLINSIIALNTIKIADSILNNDLFGEFSTDYTLVKDTSGFIPAGTGNIYLLDPQFANFPDNLELNASSPAINNGTPDTTGLQLPESDLNMNPRVFQRIDMGAYEYQEELSDSLAIIPGSIAFGDIIIGLFAVDSITFYNAGTSTILIDSLLLPADYYLSTGDEVWLSRLDSVIIYAANDIGLHFLFQPQVPGEYFDSALVYTNIQSEPYLIDLSGNGILPIPLEISENCPDTIFAGQYYSCNLEIETFNGFPFSYSVIEKPEWINIDYMGENMIEINGLPNTVDTGKHFIHLVIDDSLTSVDYYQEINVKVPAPPEIQHNCIDFVLAGQTYQCNINTIDPNHLPVELEIGDYPAWISWEKISNDTILISGVPGISDVGTVTINFYAVDSLIGNNISINITVGVNGISNMNLSPNTDNIILSPNPAKYWITISLPDNKSREIVEISIVNLFGLEVMKTNEFFKKTINLDISDLSGGLYIVMCKTADNTTIKGKLQIIR